MAKLTAAQRTALTKKIGALEASHAALKAPPARPVQRQYPGMQRPGDPSKMQSLSSMC